MEQYYLRQLRACQPISLQQLLDAKEARVLRQQRMMQQQGGTLISFTLNIAGGVKSFPLFSYAFALGKESILLQLQFAGAEVLQQEEVHQPTGDELCLLTDLEPLEVKRLMTQIEEDGALGRLFDIDVMTAESPKISRQQLGLPPRRCLLCEQQAAVCARSQAHDIRQLQSRTVQIICEQLMGRCADDIASTACRALLYEVHTAPKPGLVDRENSGAHSDMQETTFFDSSCALYPYFRQAALLGAQYGSNSDTFQKLRWKGKQAEQRMRQATGGVNTHKGAIFSMGIFCAAMAAASLKEGGYSRTRLAEGCAALCKGLCDDFVQLDRGLRPPRSYGEHLYCQYGIVGIRGEAERGFPSVMQLGLPALQAALKRGEGCNDAALYALLQLMTSVEDTNVLTRSDLQTLKWMQQQADSMLQKERLDHHLLQELDARMIERNISPGGCADLLALCLFVHFWEENLSKGILPYPQESGDLFGENAENKAFTIK